MTLFRPELARLSAFERPLHEFPKIFPVFLQKFCEPFASYIVCSMLTNGLPLQTGLALYCSPD